jgi:hypothetical protein
MNSINYNRNEGSGIDQALLFLYHVQATSFAVHPSSHGHSLYVQIIIKIE